MGKKNRNLARFMQEHTEFFGSFLMSIAHAYEHADGDNQAILDPAFELFDQKYALTDKYIVVRGHHPYKGVK